MNTLFRIRRLAITGIWLVPFTLLALPAAQAQDTFPNHYIRIISPFAAASVSDLTLRLLAAQAGPRLKTQIVVENMPSGGGIQAARTVKAAAADGYTLTLLSNASAVTLATFKNPGFDPVKDFVPITGLSDFAYLVLVKNDSAYKSLTDVVAAAKASPGKLNVGTSAPGTTPYLTALLLKKAAGIDFTIVPFRGAAELSLALMRGDIDVMINTFGGVRQNLADKQLRAVATTTRERSSFLPDVQTVLEAGIANVDVSSWNGIFAPASTPAPIVRELTAAFQATLASPDLRKRFSELGVEVWPEASAGVTARMNNDIARWNKVVDDFGLARE